MLVYVCHAYSGDPEGNVEKIKGICQELIAAEFVPIAPQLYFPQLFDEATQRPQALQACKELMLKCDAVFVYGDVLSEGMREELGVAYQNQKMVENHSSVQIKAVPATDDNAPWEVSNVSVAG